MKLAVLSYHKNVNKLYKPEWIEQYRQSILNQTHNDYTIFEVNYGKGKERIFENSYFESVKMPTFVHALNYLLDKVFSGRYDVAANTNCDDYYRHDWLERLMGNIMEGYDLVSSNFCLLSEEQIIKYHQFHELNIKEELERGHNIVSHPSVLYAKNFWKHNRYDPSQMPVEDLELWKRAINNGMKIFINKENLLYHRIHNQSVCQSENR